MGNLQSADNCEYCEPPAIFWSFELRAEQNARAVIITRLKSIAYNLHADLATAKINIKSLSAILCISPSESREEVVCCNASVEEREWKNVVRVALCFFLVVFFSRYDIDIWLATVSLAELMKSPEASDWSTLASDWSNKITFSNSNMGLRAKVRHGKNLVLTCASKKRDGVKSFPSLEF